MAGQQLKYVWWLIAATVCLSGCVAESFISNDLPNFEQDTPDAYEYPTVLVCLLVRNKAHTLPYFLGLFEDLDYPKEFLSLFIRTDHNSDNSSEILAEWVNEAIPFYKHIDFESSNDEESYPREEDIFDWTEARYQRLIELKEDAFEKAADLKVHYVFFVDADQFLTHNRVLQHLMAEKKLVIAPMLRALHSNYSNFWESTTNDGYFRQTHAYMQILRRNVTGCFEVPMVHSTFLVDVTADQAGLLTFDPEILIDFEGARDDTLVFAASARAAMVEMFVLNTEDFGILLPPTQTGSYSGADREAMRYLLLESLFNGPPGLLYSPLVPPVYPTSSRFGFDKIYLINLDRREDRKERMEACFRLVGIDFGRVSATDGKALNVSDLRDLGITIMPDYLDPYHKRPMTLGEVGCFMSHYRIWQEIDKEGYDRVLVFEDDLRFVKYFEAYLRKIVLDIDAAQFSDWDLIYLGRKRLVSEEEGRPLSCCPFLYDVSYSYWTLAYALSGRGAKKLLAGNPLTKLVPVDEYLPIMFDKHPETAWKNHFPDRNLKAYTTDPLLVHPTHYTGEQGYISDTEDAIVIEPPRVDPFPLGEESHTPIKIEL